MGDINQYLQYAYSEDGIKDIINRTTKTYSRIKTAAQKPEGLGFEFAVYAEGNQQNLGAINFAQTLPDGGTQSVINGRVLPKETVQVVNLTNYQIQAGAGSAAFANVLTDNMDKGMADHAKELNQQIYRTGTGIIAKVNGAVSGSTSVVFDNGIPTHFMRGMLLAFYNGSTLESTGRKVTNIDYNTNTITLDSAVTLTDNDDIYRVVGTVDTKQNAPVGGKELNGLPLVTDNGSLATVYENIDRSVYAQFDGIALDKNGANLSDDMLQSLRSSILEQSGVEVTGATHKIFTSPRQFRKYMQIVIPQLRFEVDGKMDSAGGSATKTWMDIEWVEDTDCGFDELYLLNMEDVQKYVLYDLKYEDKFGGGVQKWNGKDAMVAYTASMLNIGCRRPNTSARLYDLAFPSQ